MDLQEDAHMVIHSGYLQNRSRFSNVFCQEEKHEHGNGTRVTPI